MKKLLIMLLILFVNNIYTSEKFYDNLDPSQRFAFAKDWLETGKQFYSLNKLNKAKACFLHVNFLYPMGEEAKEARELLKKYFKTNVIYDPEKYFDMYEKRGDLFKETDKKLNNYLMCLEIKKSGKIYQKIALLYLNNNEQEKAKENILKAIEAGLPEKEIDPSLKDLLKN